MKNLMNIENKIPFMTGVELAHAIQTKKISSRNVLEILVRRVKKFNPELNAIILFNLEHARERCDAADIALSKNKIWGPLHGVPMTVKECNDVAGWPTTLGHKERRNTVITENEVMIQRIIDAGAIIFGKTNLPLDAMDFQTYNDLYGSTSNPWDLTRTPGGSSGASAVAVACGFTPFELGGDIGGSIRIPAAYCGVYGHKPTYNLIPKRGPSLTKKPLTISVRGPLARSVEDLKLLLQVCAGPDRSTVGEGWQLSLPKPIKSSLKEYKIAFWIDDKLCPVDDELINAGKKVASALEASGATVEWNARPEFDPWKNFITWVKLNAGNRALLHGEDRISIVKFRTAQEKQQEIREAWRKFFDEYDVIILPSHCTPAFKKNESGKMSSRTLTYIHEGQKITYKYDNSIFWATLTNVAWLPSTTFPCGITREGLPLGLNVVSKEWNDLITLDFARLLKVECGFDFHPPPGYDSRSKL